MAHPPEPHTPLAAESPAGYFATATEWLTAFGDFLWANIGLTLFVGWCLALFLLTNMLKPLVRKVVKDREDSELLMGFMPSLIGVSLGWIVIPAMASMTSYLGTVHWTVGALGGAVSGQIVRGCYDLSRNRKVRRWAEVMFRKVYDRIPFLPKLTEEEQKYIDTTAKQSPAQMAELYAELAKEESKGTDDE